MSNQISTFDFKSNPVRVQSLNDEPYFCLSDVCLVLGVNRRSADAFRLNEKGCNNIAVLTKGGKQEVTFINEPNLYRIIFRSNKKEAVEFQNWVFEEVLPQIRKTGAYQLKTTVDDRTGLRNAVNMLVSKKGLIYSEAYNLVHQYMNVESIEDIPAEKLPMAVEYVHKIALEGELITNPFKPNDSVQVPLYTFKAIMQHARFAKKLAEKTEHVHRELFSLLGLERYVRNDLAALAYDIKSEFNVWLNEGEAILAKADPSCVERIRLS